MYVCRYVYCGADRQTTRAEETAERGGCQTGDHPL